MLVLIVMCGSLSYAVVASRATRATTISHSEDMTTSGQIKTRCVNIDWLEVYCLEPPTHQCTAEYFRAAGYDVKPRAYGTPQYREMFTIFDKDGAFIEVRRNPYSIKKQGGIFDSRATHLRLNNKTCYRAQPIKDLRQFIIKHGYEFKNVTRLDICVDLLTFDDGQNPSDFIAAYLRGEYLKLHLNRFQSYGEEAIGGKFAFHGHETIFTRVYNSIKWGAEKSAISVKIYNKTKELQEVKDKAYIRQTWMDAGLINQQDNLMMAKVRDCRYNINNLNYKIREASGMKREALMKSRNKWQTTLEHLKPQLKQVWRVEISLKSEFKGIVNGDGLDIDDKGRHRVYDINLNNIDNRDKQLFIFHVITSKYLHFKIPSYTRDGTPQRKDRCQSYWPIMPTTLEAAYIPKPHKNIADMTRSDKIMINRLRELLEENPKESHLAGEMREAVKEILCYYANKKDLDEVKAAIDRLQMKLDQNTTYISDKIERLTELKKQLDDAITDYYDNGKSGTVVPQSDFQKTTTEEQKTAATLDDIAWP